MAKFSGGGSLSGALSGASIGGSVGGPVGAGIGGLVGGGLGGFAGGGKKPKLKKLSTLTEGQQSLLDMLLEQARGMGGQGGGLSGANQYYNSILNQEPEAFQRFAQPFMDQFNQQIIPGLAERFAGAGAQGGALSSSGFGQALGTAGGALQNQLAALKASLMGGAAQAQYGQYNQLANQGLGTAAFGYQPQSGQTGGLQNLLLGHLGKMSSGDYANVGNNLGELYQKYMPLMGNV